jgi:hypothetical protein
MGGPFEGKYRDASIVHDWYCDLRTRSWQNVHLVFYEAMLTSGVALSRARLMYAAVYWGGPRWSDTVVSNLDRFIQLYRERNPEEAARSDRLGRRFNRTPDPENYRDARNYPVETTITTTVSRYEMDQADLADLEQAVSANDLGLDGLTAIIEGRLESRQATEVGKYVRKEGPRYDLIGRYQLPRDFGSA